MQAYLLSIYGISFNRPRALLKYILLVTISLKSLLKLFSTKLRHIMLHWFKKNNSANNIADKICTVYYLLEMMLSQSFAIDLRDLELAILI